MNKYATAYFNGAHLFASHIYANSLEEAKLIAEKRNIGEIIEGELNNKPKKVKHKDLLHEVCFLSYICLKSGVIDIEKTLGDCGVLHEIIHHLYPNMKLKIDEELMSKIEWLRKITPGYYPV